MVQARRRQLRVGSLEGRVVPSVLFVDPSGVGPGGASAYTTIQNAVNAASAGTMIVVDPATYTEDVMVATSGIALYGAQAGINPVPGRAGPESVLNGSINITAPGVSVDGFTINTTEKTGIDVSQASNVIAANSLLTDNIITNNTGNYDIILGELSGPATPNLHSVVKDNVLSSGGAAVYLFDTSYNLVEGNLVTQGSVSGIDNYYSPADAIIGNTVNNCGNGIRFRGTSGCLAVNNSGSNDSSPITETENSSNNTIFNNPLQASETETGTAQLFVDPSGTGPGGVTAYTSIQAAVNAASAGTMIVVDPATYSQDVTIATNGIGLYGAQAGVDPVPGRSGGESVIHGSVTVTGANVAVDGFTFNTGEQWDIEVGGTNVPSVAATNALIADNIVNNTTVYGIQIGAEGGPNTQQVPLYAVVQDNVVSTSNADIWTSNAAGNTIQGNLVTGSSFAGIDLYYSDNDAVLGNTVNNCPYCAVHLRGNSGNLVENNSGTGDGSTPILQEEGATNNTLLNNNFTGGNSPCVLFVDPSGTGPGGVAAYTTIQGAVNAVSAGTMIVVDAATYTEDVTIATNDIRLYGAQAGINPVPARTGAESVLKGSITITGANVTVDGFKANSTEQWAIEIGGLHPPSLAATNALVTDNIVNASGYGIQIGAAGGPSTQQVPLYAVVQDNVVVSNGGDIDAFNTGHNTVRGNLIQSNPNEFGSAIDMYYSNNDLIDGNIINDAPTPTSPWYFAAISLQSDAGQQGPSGNLIINNTGTGDGQPAIYPFPGTSNNTIFNNPVDPSYSEIGTAQLFVDASGTGPGGVAAYTTIQSAVNAAAAGTTIVVDPGTYTEDVTIATSEITLLGAQAGIDPVGGRSGSESIVSGSITVSAPGVTVDGFTVNTSEQWAIGMGATNALATNGVVTDNIVTNSSATYGIQIGQGYGAGTLVNLYALVQDNAVSNGGAGIDPFNTGENTVEGNFISGNSVELSGVDNYYSNQDAILGNIINGCTLAAVRQRGSHYDLVANNSGSGNAAGVTDETESSNNTELNNTFGSALLVTTTQDTGVSGDGSLRGEIAAAGSNGIIEFAASLAGHAVVLTHGELSLTKSLSIIGLGSNQTVINASYASRVFEVSGNVRISIQDITIEHGLATDGGTAGGNAGLGGGLLNNGGTVSLTNVVVQSNSAWGNPGQNAQGGGIYSNGASLTLTGCTISSNVARGGPGTDVGNLVVNGNFEQGNTGFTTQYTYSEADIGPAETYAIVTSPANARPHDINPVSYGDHTTGHGLMMAVNGAEVANVLVWSETVAVQPNTTYTLGAWISSWFGSAPAQLSVLVNGGSVGTLNAPSTTAVWVPFSTTWYSGSATSASIELRNLTTADIGNDFALDDISFTGPTTGTRPGGTGQGGGVYVSGGTTTFSQDTFAHNLAHGGDGLNRVNSGTSVTVRGGNGSDGQGGGLYTASGTVSLSDCTLGQNTASGGAGGLGGDGVAGFSASGSAGHGGNGGAGGDGGNGVGGGIYNAAATLTLTRDTLASNTATGGGGGHGGNGGAGGSAVWYNTGGTSPGNAHGGSGGRGGHGGQGGDSAGAGLFMASGSLILTNDTLALNSTVGGTGGAAGQGGDGGAATLYASGTTHTYGAFGGNGGTGGDGGSGGNGLGGGLYSGAATVVLTNATLAQNAAVRGYGGAALQFPPAGGQGLIITPQGTSPGSYGSPGATGSYGAGGNSQGGGLYAPSGSLTLYSTLTAHNTADSAPDFSGAVTASSHSLVGDGTGSSGFSAANGDQVGTASSPIDPKLGPLQDNGGPTGVETVALLPGSPAIDTGDNGYAPSTDARGLPRIVNAVVDIGAYEYQTVGPTLTLDTAGNLTFIGLAGASDQLTISLANGVYSFNDTNPGGIAVTGPGAGDCTGAGTQTVTCPAGTVSNILVNVGGLYGVNLRGTSVPTTITDAVGGNSTLTIGSLAPALGGTLAGIQAPISVANPTDPLAVVLDDSGDSTGRTATLTSGVVIGLAPATISFSAGQGAVLTVDCGAGNDKVTVQGVSAFMPVGINGGGGNDTFQVGDASHSLIGVRGGLTLDGQGGTNSLIVDDQADFSRIYHLNSASITLTGVTTIAYANMHTVAITAGGNDTLYVGTPLPGLYTFNGGAGVNTIIGPNAGSTWTISGTNSGKVNQVSFTHVQYLVGGTANDFFKFGHGGSIAGTINGGGGSGNRLDYSGNGGVAVTVNLANDSAPNIDGGAAGGFSNIGMLIGSSGSDTLIGPNTTNAWSVTGTNAGKVNKFSFKSVESLVGGTGVDTFKLSSAGKVAHIDGGGSPTREGDWLDYSAFSSTSPISVNLATGSATGIGGGAAGAVLNVQNVAGGAGNDTLTGNSLGNILIGGSGNDTLTAGSGRSLLIGDAGSDTINDGSGSDILISGTTTYDKNHTALMDILAEWQRTDESYAQRLTHLKSGGGLNLSYKLIWGSTVKDDLKPDLLNGAVGGLDWFFANLAAGQDTINNLNGNEQVN